jgi:hypothetical protein
MNYIRTQIAAACSQFGSRVAGLPDGVDGTQLLWAMSGVESSFGANCTPRHEPAFDVGGKESQGEPQPQKLALYGSAAACSYGPLQLMFCNVPLTMSPSMIDTSLTLAMQCSVIFLNGLLRHWKPSSLAEIGECWNAGHITPDPAYEAKLQACYDVAMPTI